MLTALESLREYGLCLGFCGGKHENFRRTFCRSFLLPKLVSAKQGKTHSLKLTQKYIASIKEQYQHTVGLLEKHTRMHQILDSCLQMKRTEKLDFHLEMQSILEKLQTHTRGKDEQYIAKSLSDCLLQLADEFKSLNSLNLGSNACFAGLSHLFDKVSIFLPSELSNILTRSEVLRNFESDIIHIHDQVLNIAVLLSKILTEDTKSGKGEETRSKVKDSACHQLEMSLKGTHEDFDSLSLDSLFDAIQKFHDNILPGSIMTEPALDKESFVSAIYASVHELTFHLNRNQAVGHDESKILQWIETIENQAFQISNSSSILNRMGSILETLSKNLKEVEIQTNSENGIREHESSIHNAIDLPQFFGEVTLDGLESLSTTDSYGHGEEVTETASIMVEYVHAVGRYSMLADLSKTLEVLLGYESCELRELQSRKQAVEWEHAPILEYLGFQMDHIGDSQSENFLIPSSCFTSRLDLFHSLESAYECLLSAHEDLESKEIREKRNHFCQLLCSAIPHQKEKLVTVWKTAENWLHQGQSMSKRICDMLKTILEFESGRDQVVHQCIAFKAPSIRKRKYWEPVCMKECCIENIEVYCNEIRRIKSKVSSINQRRKKLEKKKKISLVSLDEEISKVSTRLAELNSKKSYDRNNIKRNASKLVGATKYSLEKYLIDLRHDLSEMLLPMLVAERRFKRLKRVFESSIFSKDNWGFLDSHSSILEALRPLRSKTSELSIAITAAIDKVHSLNQPLETNSKTNDLAVKQAAKLVKGLKRSMDSIHSMVSWCMVLYITIAFLTGTLSYAVERS